MELRDIIKEAVAGFLGNAGSLSDIIYDIARRESLNEHMIRRVCEGANTETRLHFYRQPGINQASALFPVADAESIINSIFPEVDAVPESSIDYMLPPDKATVKIVVIDEDEKPKKEKKPDREKEASLQLSYSRYQDARHDFFEKVRQHVLWGEEPEDINKMASYIDDQETLRAVFPKLKEYLEDKRLDKSAAPIESYLNKKLNITFVVGDNPLVIKYKNLDKCRRRVVGEIHHPKMKENTHDHA